MKAIGAWVLEKITVAVLLAIWDLIMKWKKDEDIKEIKGKIKEGMEKADGDSIEERMEGNQISEDVYNDLT